MTGRLRGAIVCPGRGSYGRTQLASLPRGHAIVTALDRIRADLGRPPVSELDQAPAYTPRLHVAGEHASLLTFACSAVDLAAIDHAKVEIVGVTGNSMGFYTALYAAGALELEDAARLVETMGAYQTDNVIGHQLVYPIVDADWRSDPALAAAVDEALAFPGVFVSIRLGGSIVLGTDAAGVDHVRRVLPTLDRGGVVYPLQLPLHSAFHTPLMAATGERARAELADLAIRSPAITLIGGDAVVYRPWADPRRLWDYTLGAQIDEPFDLERAVAAVLGELAPDVLILPGPGDNLGGALAQILIARRWRGLTCRGDFLAAQASDHPIVIGMARSDQRARITA
ncbi:MAG: ACP S-malonyltransferase [Kofleriaceae bacterium]